jgi:predicted TIM-barrel fold metal-dependent hydrolase
VRDTSEAARDWAVGVCTLDPDDPHSPEVLYALVERSNVKGMRSVPASDGGYDHPGVRRLWGEAERLGIVINSLVPAALADELSALVNDHPDLRVVLDHGLSLKAGPEYDATVSKVTELARYPNLFVKLTFIPTGSAEEYPFRDMHDACRRFIEAYGPERCVWGSNFPVELWCPKVTYQGHLRIFREELGLTESEQTAILGGTAERLWFS